jgi:triosephosphate isomerase
MKKIIIANWKSNPRNIDEAKKLAKATDFIDAVICPPFPFLETVGNVIKKSSLGAQDVFWGDIGAYTGEVSWRHLKNLGVKYVIIGHSERRRYLKESDELISRKVEAALKAGLKVVLCVGEGLNIHNEGADPVKIFVKDQLEKNLPVNFDSDIAGSRLTVAYEPVWAISTEAGGKPDTPENAVEMIKFIKGILNSDFNVANPKVIYGGSVNAKNAAEFLRNKEIDGALVGGASLKPKEFKLIVDTKY